MAPEAPANEAEKLGALRSYAILDTAPELAYDEITELAAPICECPVAVIGFVDETRDCARRRRVRRRRVRLRSIPPLQSLRSSLATGNQRRSC